MSPRIISFSCSWRYKFCFLRKLWISSLRNVSIITSCLKLFFFFFYFWLELWCTFEVLFPRAEWCWCPTTSGSSAWCARSCGCVERRRCAALRAALMSTEHLLKRRFRPHYKVCSLVSYFNILATRFLLCYKVTQARSFVEIVTIYIFIYLKKTLPKKALLYRSVQVCNMSYLLNQLRQYKRYLSI